MGYANNEKRKITKGIELANQEKSESSEKKCNLKILGNIGNGHNQTNGYERWL